MAPLIVALMYACRIYSDDFTERASEVNASEPIQLRLQAQNQGNGLFVSRKGIICSCRNCRSLATSGFQEKHLHFFHVISRKRQKADSLLKLFSSLRHTSLAMVTSPLPLLEAFW